MDMKKEFPSQTKNRRQWILDTVREHQQCVEEILFFARTQQYDLAKLNLDVLHKQDRDALLQPGGIFTNEQIEILSNTGESQNTETSERISTET